MQSCGNRGEDSTIQGGLSQTRIEYLKDTKESLHRCQAITQKGTQCKRRARPDSDYCWQHDK